MVSSTLCPAVHILGSQNVYGRQRVSLTITGPGPSFFNFFSLSFLSFFHPFFSCFFVSCFPYFVHFFPSFSMIVSSNVCLHSLTGCEIFVRNSVSVRLCLSVGLSVGLCLFFFLPCCRTFFLPFCLPPILFFLTFFSTAIR